MKLLYLFLVAIMLYAFSPSMDHVSSPKRKKPISLKYIGTPPPDSICEFIVSYFKIKKVEVFSANNDVSAIFREKGAQVEAIFREYSDGINLSDNVKNIIESPITNMIFLKAFPDTIAKNIYTIDSIHWDIKSVPYKDSTNYFKTFKLDTRHENAYQYFKEFIDYLIIKEKL